MTVGSPHCGRISVCIANFNGAEVIEACLDSVLSQVVDSDIEVLLHDDASTDNSVQRITDNYPQVKFIISNQNVGFCTANNRMVEQASGDYLLLLNNDARLDEGALSALLEGSVQYPGAILTLPQYEAGSGQLVDCGMSIDLFANASMCQSVVEQPVAMVMGACLWLPRELWDRCRGMPQHFGSMAEDMYLCNCARLMGREVVALGRSGYHHHVGLSFGGGKVINSGLATTVKRRQLSERNRTYVMAMTFPAPAVCLLLPLHVLMLLLEGIALSVIKWDKSLLRSIYWHAVTSCFAQRTYLWQSRCELQSQRVISNREFFSRYRFIPHKLIMLLRHGLPRLDRDVE